MDKIIFMTQDRLTPVLSGFGTSQQSQSELMKYLGFVPGTPFFFLKQIHTNVVHQISPELECSGKEGDALFWSGRINESKDFAIGVQTADCVPIIVHMQKNSHHLLAVIHSGWRGTNAKILDSLFEEIEKKTGLDALHFETKQAYIGPCICQNHYEVGKEVFDSFKTEYCQSLKQVDKEHWLLDLKNIIGVQLENLGFKKNQIKISKACTFQEPSLASYRRDGKKSGRQWAIIGLKHHD